MKILFFISSFQSGGAERVASILLGKWRKAGHEVVAAEWSIKDSFYELDPGIRLLRLGFNASAGPPPRRGAGPWRKLSGMRALIRDERPDVVVSFMTRQNVYAIMAGIGLGVPVIVSEHSLRGVPLVSKGLDLLRSITYRMANKVVLLTEEDRGAYPFLRNAVAIGNPVELPAATGGEARRASILAVGRLAREKGMDRLVEAFARMPDRHGYTLEIAGDGPDRPALERRIKDLGLEGQVCLLGRRSDVYALYERAAFLVLASRHEGFGMVLVEAMAFGCPVIAFDCPCGPREIIHDGLDGLLVPDGDIDALAAAMERLASDAELRDRLGREGLAVRERYGSYKIAASWEALFAGVARRDGLAGDSVR